MKTTQRTFWFSYMMILDNGLRQVGAASSSFAIPEGQHLLDRHALEQMKGFIAGEFPGSIADEVVLLSWNEIAG